MRAALHMLLEKEMVPIQPTNLIWDPFHQSCRCMPHGDFALIEHMRLYILREKIFMILLIGDRNQVFTDIRCGMKRKW